MTYTKRIDNKEVLTNQVFKLFTDSVGGNSKDFADMLYSRYTVEDLFMNDDYNYFTILDYFQKKVIPHKIAVYQAGIELLRIDFIKSVLQRDEIELIKENLWIHDMSKFSLNESYAYAFHNFKNKEYSESFEKAWHHHKQNNPHHPEYWLNPNRSGELDILQMPNVYLIEMIADWIGASKTYGSSLHEWLPNNLHKFIFNKNTAIDLSIILHHLGVQTEVRYNTLKVV